MQVLCKKLNLHNPVYQNLRENSAVYKESGVSLTVTMRPTKSLPQVSLVLKIVWFFTMVGV